MARPNTFTYRVDLGGNYFMHFISERINPKVPGEHRMIMALLVDMAHVNGNPSYDGIVVSIMGDNPTDCITNAKQYLMNQRGLNRVLDELT